MGLPCSSVLWVGVVVIVLPIVLMGLFLGLPLLKRMLREYVQVGHEHLLSYPYLPTHPPFMMIFSSYLTLYEVVSESSWTGRLERELQIVQLSATRCSCIAILWVSLVSYAAITLRVASEQGFVIDVFVIVSVRKLLGIPSYNPP
jgi:hypothetical protein